MIRNQFKNVKIGGIFTNSDSFMFFRKVSSQECRAVRMSHDGKWRVIRNTSAVWWMQPSDVVYFQSWNEHNENCKYCKPQSNKQRDARKRWQAAGTLARARSNLRTVMADFQSKLNLVQIKKLQDAQMVLGWLAQQSRSK